MSEQHDDFDFDWRTYDFYVNAEQHGYDYEGNNSASNSGFFEFTFGIIRFFSGAVIQGIIYTALDIDVDDVPVIVLCILWFVFSMLFSLATAYIGKRLH